MEEGSNRRRPFLHRVGEVGASVGSRPPRKRGVRVALQLGIAILIFGFLVLTVVSQWDEVREEGVEFEVIWLLPAFCVLTLFYFFGALGWDLIRTTRTLSDLVRRNVPDHARPPKVTMTRSDWVRT